MRLPKPKKSYCTESFVYREYLGENKWSEPAYAEPVTIENCRIDRWPEFTSTASGRQILYNAVIYCYAGITNPLPEFKMQSIIHFDGRDHTVTKVIPIYEPFRRSLYSYELEVV